MSVFRLVSLLAMALVASPLFAQVSRIDPLIDGRPELKKLSGDLIHARHAHQVRGLALAEALQAHLPDAALRDGKIQVIVKANQVTDSLLAAAKAQKAEIVGTYPQYDAITIQVPNFAAIEALAARKDVLGITAEPARMTWAGSVTSQADSSMKAALARTDFSVDGAGLKLGVLSDTFHRVIGGSLVGQTLTGSSSQNSGDLPASVEILDAGPVIGSDEGAGMAELIYDLAPGCDIAFASAFSGYLAFASNIDALVAAGCDVIVDDVIYFAEPMYQDGPIAVAADNAVAMGVPYYSSAGNSAAQAHESAFNDVNPSVHDVTTYPSGNDLHDFGGGDTHLTLTLADGASILPVLHWDQPYDSNSGVGEGSGATTDLELFIVSSTSLPITSSIVLTSSGNIQGNINSPSGDPVEVPANFYVNATGSNQTVHIVIDRYNDPPTADTPSLISLKIFKSGTVTFNDSALMGARTIYGHAAAEDAQAVGAMFYGEIDDNNLTGSPGVYDVESFSSKGGNLPFYFDSNGNALAGAPVVRFKPEITAADGTNTTFFGSDSGSDVDAYPNFFGTSAAAPHAAAVAALMFSRFPATTPAQVYAAMQATAVDSETAGLDDLSGHGWVDAQAAVGAFEPDVTATPANLDFGSQDIEDGATAPQDITLTNDGYVDLSSISVSLLSGADFTIAADTAEATLAYGGVDSRIISITFDPSTTGSKNDTLRVTSNDPDESPLDIPIVGSGTGVPEIDVTPLLLGFTDRDINAGASAAQDVTITNVGSATLSISSVSLASGSFTISGDTGETSLAPAASRTVSLTFDPPTSGTKVASLTIESDDTDESTVNVQLSGDGVITDGSLAVAWVQFDHTGEEAGTETLPLDSLNEGIAAVAASGTLRIKAGSTAAAPRITKAMRIEAPAGAVRLGVAP